MNALPIILYIISAPWHFGLTGGWSAGLYGWNAETGDYNNPNSHFHIQASRPAIPPPGYWKFGIFLEDEKSLGYTLDFGVHYRTYHVSGYADTIPYLPDSVRMDIEQDVPYVHMQIGGGVQKTLEVAGGRIMFPMGGQLTYNYFIPALTQDLVDTYAEALGEELKNLSTAMDWFNHPELVIDYIDEHKMGLRLNFGCMGAIVHSPHFSWLMGAGLDWNILFGANRNDLVLYPEFSLTTGFRF